MHFARNKCYGMVSSVPVSLFIGRLIKTRVWVFSNCIKEINPRKRKSFRCVCGSSHVLSYFAIADLCSILSIIKDNKTGSRSMDNSSSTSPSSQITHFSRYTLNFKAIALICCNEMLL